MTPQYLNQLKIHMLYVNESPELSDQKTQEYVDKFDKLDKYDQLSISLLIESSNVESAIELIDRLLA